MFKVIHQKLKESLIIEENEPVLSLIQVNDHLKVQNLLKKVTRDELAAILPNKLYYLLATIKICDNDSTPIIYLLKQNEKNHELKLKVTWDLKEIKSITQIDENSSNKNSKDVFLFEIIFKSDNEYHNDHRKFIWECDKQQDRSDFLNTLWKLSEEFLKVSDQPKFINYQFENRSNDLNGTDSKNSTSNNKSVGSASNHYEITKTEEDTLLKLMSECDFASSNAEKFMEKLQSELLYLDTSNIESIMNSEENTLKLIDMLDSAVEEIDKIDRRLKDYEDKISAVGDAVRIVGERDNVIQLQQNNQHALLDLLENMMSMLEFPKEMSHILSECDLSSVKRVDRCMIAANQLLDIIESDFPIGLKKMKAYEEQITILERTKLKFCNMAYNHIKNIISHTTNKHLESYKIVDNTLNALPPHKQIHDELIVLKDLMPWIYRSNCSYNDHDQRKTYFNDIKQNYIETVKQLYLLEIVPFCTCAKAKIIKHDKPKATASMENLKGSLIRTLDKSHTGDQFTIKIDQSTKETFKLVFSKLLNQLSVVVQNEQTFCQEFFNINKPSNQTNDNSQSMLVSQNSTSSQMPRNSSSASLASNNTVNSKQINSTESKNDLAILREIFTTLIEEQVKLIIECIIKTENMMVIFIYSDLLFRVLVSHNNKQFMHQPLVSLLRTGKEKCDEFVNHFKDLIKDYKVNKREKIGIIKYVSYYEEFVKEAELCWEPIKKDMYEKLCIIYQILVNEIYKGIETVAMDSQKTPPDVVRFQNYHQMHHVMRGVNGCKESTKYAKDQYTIWKQSYVKEHFGRPLEKLHNFFEKVDAKIERGYKHEDISYQLELSSNNLREIIRDYPAKEVKKGLENLYNKVEKHLVDRSSLLEVVWRDMSNEFIRQYKNYENLIIKCYPGQKISLEFSEQEICEFFQDIAQTH